MSSSCGESDQHERESQLLMVIIPFAIRRKTAQEAIAHQPEVVLVRTQELRERVSQRGR